MLPWKKKTSPPEPLPDAGIAASGQDELSAILKKVRQIEIRTRGLSNHIFSGEYHSAFKGRGMSFSEVREYAYGDDVRNIDWNVTARFRSPYIKVFEEERELTLMLLVDISASSLFGTRKQSKRDLITEICAVLSFSAINNNDKVGVLFFSDRVERYVPPKKGRSHILFIIRELLSLKPQPGAGTDVGHALRYLNRILKKRSICFVLSDFASAPYEQDLQIAARRHDLAGLRVYDPTDETLPDVGLLQAADPETGEIRWLDTSQKTLRESYARRYRAQVEQTQAHFVRAGADLMHIATTDDHVKKLQVFFKSRF